ITLISVWATGNNISIFLLLNVLSFRKIKYYALSRKEISSFYIRI
ncbi:hypothetical protein SULYE_1343, partial [Sulfurihydrogenibium yellowstonense SS-5]